jgi:uncharacterized UBP type Zn finger protein
MGSMATIRFMFQQWRGHGSRPCTHLDQIRDVEPSTTGCLQCIALGDTWVHLRQCMTCGTVGCCDSSKNKHASRHARDLDHQIVRSLQPGEDWLWCYADQTLIGD